MGIWEYIKEWWLELWNPDSRAWQIADRILFPLLPFIVLLLHCLPNMPKGWWDVVVNLFWIIPLSIWLLFFFLVVPYRLVNKYKKKLIKAQAKLAQKPKALPLPNRDELIRTIGEVKGVAIELFNLQSTLEVMENHLPDFALTWRNYVDGAFNRFDKAMNEFDVEILVAGVLFKQVLSELRNFIWTQIYLKLKFPIQSNAQLLNQIEFSIELNNRIGEIIKEIDRVG